MNEWQAGLLCLQSSLTRAAVGCSGSACRCSGLAGLRRAFLGVALRVIGWLERG